MLYGPACTVKRDERQVERLGYGDPMTSLVEHLRALREARGISLRELAPKIGVSFPTLNAYELGRVDPPMSRAISWASALGVSLHVIATDAEHVDPDDPTLSVEQRALLRKVLSAVGRLEDGEARMLRLQIELVEQRRGT